VQIRSSKMEKADHVFVTIGGVWVHRSGQSGSEGWQLISNQSQTVDLVTLENTTTLFGKGQISLGDYDTVRMEISNITWVFNKTTTNLEVESSQIQSNLDFTVQAGRETIITLVLAGQQQEIRGTNFLVPTLTATLG
jgi:glycine cleavage system aminomethyltransferase T